MTLSIDVVPNPQKEGCEVKIKISGALPNATISVTASNADGGSENIDITVDSNGNGDALWPIPQGWAGAYSADFTAPGASADTILVDPPEGDCYAIPDDELE